MIHPLSRGLSRYTEIATEVLVVESPIITIGFLGIGDEFSRRIIEGTWFVARFMRPIPIVVLTVIMIVAPWIHH